MRHRSARARRWSLAGGVVLLSGLVLAACGTEGNGQNSLEPKGTAAHTIDDLLLPVFLIAAVVGVLVIAATVFLAIRYRYRPGKNENPKQIHGSTPFEISWTIAPALILAIIAVPTVRTIFDLQDTPRGDHVLEVKAIGKQWWWQFEYLDAGLEKGNGDKVVTANELVIPTDTKVRVELTACDPSIGGCNVIHSFWVPELAGKTDVVPGRENVAQYLEAPDPGTYLGQCAEYCGLSHANMRFRVIAMEPDDYEDWIAGQREGPATPLSVGPEDAPEPAGRAQDLFVNKFLCSGCHTADLSTGAEASSYGPNLTHLASRTTFASGYYPLERDLLIDWILDAPSMIPMESEGCRLPPAPDVTCVGMPSFIHDTPPGMDVMTRDEAEEIADYLLSLK
jgi:cytochrome c oxidase subunit II